jgi:deoxyribose-phosphate aldolase
MTPSLLDWRQAAAMIDHTQLRADASTSQIELLCREAAAYGFYSVMVNPCRVAECVQSLDGSPVRTGTVIGFPLGATTTRAKLCESEEMLELGAAELDMVLNAGLLKSGRLDRAEAEIAQLAALAHSGGAKLKVILEMCLLTETEKIAACRAAQLAGADFVKTSTGFAAGGATVADVRLMRATVGAEMGVKAAGGIRTKDDFLAMAAAGANRVGCSAGVAIVRALGAPEMK